MLGNVCRTTVIVVRNVKWSQRGQARCRHEPLDFRQLALDDGLRRVVGRRRRASGGGFVALRRAPAQTKPDKL
jgi:hypothetical protein